MPEHKFLVATKLYIKEQANDLIHGLKQPAKLEKKNTRKSKKSKKCASSSR